MIGEKGNSGFLQCYTYINKHRKYSINKFLIQTKLMARIYVIGILQTLRPNNSF